MKTTIGHTKDSRHTKNRAQILYNINKTEGEAAFIAKKWRRKQNHMGPTDLARSVKGNFSA
jgi:hypothetical protein